MIQLSVEEAVGDRDEDAFDVAGDISITGFGDAESFDDAEVDFTGDLFGSITGLGDAESLD